MSIAKLSIMGAEEAQTLASSYGFKDAVKDIQNGISLELATSRLISRMTKEERLWLLDGDLEFYDGLRTMFHERYNIRPFVMGNVPRLGVPGIRFTDGPRGVVAGESTAFPVSMARGATFDTKLERMIGQVIGKEAKAQGANYYAGVCINLPRHPAWGRSQETYSDDSLLLGAFGTALTIGVQEHVMACVKHFALNSMENARFRVNVKVDESVLHEVYLPHFKRVIDSGVASVMSAYNAVNDEWAGQSRLLLTDILRDMWHFDGFVMSDFVFGLRDSALSLKNGLDIEAPFRQQRAQNLRRRVETGEASWADVDRAASRLISKQLQYYSSSAAASQPSEAYCEEHRALARKAAAHSVVLLKNEPIGGTPLLPLDTTSLKSIAIIGRLARSDNTGDLGSSRVLSPHVVTLVEALQIALPRVNVIVDDSDTIQGARTTAQAADVAICIVGYGAHDEGEYVIPSLQQDPDLKDLLPLPKSAAEAEIAAILRGEVTSGSQGLEAGAGGDRKSLRLRARDQEIVSAVTEINPKTIMSVVCAGAVIMHDLIAKVPVALISWYGGCEGGHGLADILLGEQDVSGRLPFSIPTTEEHLPSFQIDAREITYDRWHGQRLLDKLGVPAAFPFGYGLSYTTFRIDEASVLVNHTAQDEHDALRVKIGITNTGTRRGRFVAQVYGLPGGEDFPSRVLVGFQPVDLDAGQSTIITIYASTQPMSRWIQGKFVLPAHEVAFEVGSHAGDVHAFKMQCRL